MLWFTQPVSQYDVRSALRRCLHACADGAGEDMLRRGSLPSAGVYAVVDFGPGTNATEAFLLQKKYNKPGMSPPFCRFAVQSR